MTEIAEEIERMRRISLDDLKCRYRDLYGKEPRVKNRTWLWKRCAWKLQEIRYGGLPGVAKQKLEELISEIGLPLLDRKRGVTGKLVEPGLPPDPKVGTTILRMFKKRELRLHVRDEGFELDGVLYPSLTAAAKAATGSRWNGRLFWLGSRKKS